MMSHEQFLSVAMAVAGRLFPDARVERGEGFMLQIDEKKVFLENLFRKAAATPDQVEELVDEHLAALGRSEPTPAGEQPWIEACERILPQIFPASKLDFPPKAMPLFQELPNDTAIAYVLDQDDRYSLIRPLDIVEWRVDAEAVHQAALENLTQRSTGVRVQALTDEEGGIAAAIFQQGDSYDSSRLLLPGLHENLRPMLGSPFLAGVPNRDFLICFRAGVDELLERVGNQVVEDFRRMPYPITDRLFLVTADGIAAWHPEPVGEE